MLRNPYFAAWFATTYLVAYCALTQFSATVDIAFNMLIFAPVLMVWLVFAVLKFKRQYGKELNEAEFGYRDKDNSELGIF